MPIFGSQLKQFATEIAELRALQSRYGIRLSILEILRLGWRGTLRAVIRHFDPADYPQLFATEQEVLVRALLLLKKLPLRDPYTLETVSQIFAEEQVPTEYYQGVLARVFADT